MGIHRRILISGGGNAGFSVATPLRHQGQTDIGIIEPGEKHCYQPLRTLIGGGRADAHELVRPQASVIPQGVAWIKDAATDVHPDACTVSLEPGQP
ncbi:hypothetical protein GCM10009715_41650 [Paeniglutamicibacter psychrophenolicus]|uniref:NADH dehydrogenase FAD-containing subunit n=1 Tax=Paeniglutamicibacter psychrophenolicus TaxID=257454 RepID=A0ABS4WKC7_9MICC|nr:hypothetical protein [Paeniglutamicibacter psychrophenolicus]MBP2376496.1 NADH dehydrogenase FAD-containing subunit [Paeniglutamicibacter psychrophenolicus]